MSRVATWFGCTHYTVAASAISLRHAISIALLGRKVLWRCILVNHFCVAVGFWIVCPELDIEQ